MAKKMNVKVVYACGEEVTEKEVLITTPATPFDCCAMQKLLTTEIIMGSRTSLIILSGRKWPAP